jgi:hypothetical protein
MSKHTPGPWEVCRVALNPQWFVGYTIGCADPNARRICDLNKYASDEEREANARLIAAAPDLLRELADLIDLADTAMHGANRDGSEYDRDAELAPARAAIARATQEQAS